MILGLSVIAGWLFHVRALIEVLPAMGAMRFNTASGFVLAGIGLRGYMKRSPATLAAGVVVFLLGVVTFGNYAGIWNIPLDEALIRDWSGHHPPGRMEPTSAACFVIIGLAYVAAGRGVPLGVIGVATAAGVLSFSGIALLGWIGMDFVPPWGAGSRMPPHTAVGFLLVAAGLLAPNWFHVERRRDTALAVGMGACVAGITLLMWLGVRAQHERVKTVEATMAARQAAQLVDAAIANRIASLTRFDVRWADNCADACHADLTSYMRDYPDLTLIGWVDTRAVPVILYRRDGSGPAVRDESEIGGPLGPPIASLVQSMSAPAGTALVTDGSRHQLLFVVHQPNAATRLIATSTAAALVTRALGAAGPERLHVTINDETIAGNPLPADAATGLVSMAILDVPWQFRADMSTAATDVSPLVLSGGLLMTCIVAATVYLWRTGQATNADLEQALRQEVAVLAKLGASEQQFRQLADAMPQIVWTARSDGRFDYLNQRWQEYSGLTFEETERVGWPAVAHPADVDATRAKFRLALANRSGVYQTECRFKRASDGSYRWHLIRTVPARDPEGTTVGWFGTATDIEDYKRVQAEILALNETLEARVQRRTEELAETNTQLEATFNRLQSVLDSATQISIIATGRDGIIRVFNAGAERMLGYDASEMVGQRTPAILHVRSELEARARELSAKRGRPIQSFDLFVEMAREDHYERREWTYVRKDGSRLEVDLGVTPARDAGGETIGVLIIAADITARKHLERQLRDKHANLEEQTLRAEAANRSKSEFLATMSHEIRTPMNAILGMAELLWESPLSPDQRQYVDVFRQSGNTLLALINDLLDLSKIESGRFELEQLPFLLDDVVERSMNLIAPRARDKGITLSLDRGRDVPAALIGDPLRLRQVLVNLLGNAVKFTERGEITLAVSNSRAAGRDAGVVFTVTDTGIGIPESQLDRIFETFTQADTSTTRQYGGTGLGLSISRRLVELMGGTISVTSTVGRGSAFTFTVPLPEASASAVIQDVKHLLGHRVLVIDDDAANRPLLRDLLAAWQLESRDFETVDEAVTDLTSVQRKDNGYSLAIVNHQRPGIDGFDATRRIHAAAPELPVVMLISDAEGRDQGRRLDSGVAGFAVKPIDRTGLLRVVSRAIRTPVVEVKPASVDVRPMSILVAEDFADNRALVQWYLKKLPYDLVFAEDGRRAIDLFKQRRFDLVLMDIQMPVVDGLQAIRAIRRFEQEEQWRPTPLIALSANARQVDIEAARAAGADAYLSKPISKQALVSEIQRFATTPTAPVDAPAPIPVDVAESLSALAAGYLDTRRAEADELPALVAAGDFERLRIIAHNVAGSGSSYGFARLTEIGRGLEAAAREHDRDAIERHVAELRDYLSRVRITGGRPV